MFEHKFVLGRKIDFFVRLLLQQEINKKHVAFWLKKFSAFWNQIHLHNSWTCLEWTLRFQMLFVFIFIDCTLSLFFILSLYETSEIKFKDRKKTASEKPTVSAIYEERTINLINFYCTSIFFEKQTQPVSFQGTLKDQEQSLAQNTGITWYHHKKKTDQI